MSAAISPIYRDVFVKTFSREVAFLIIKFLTFIVLLVSLLTFNVNIHRFKILIDTKILLYLD